MKLLSFFFITACIATLMFTSCGRKDNPFYGLSDEQKAYFGFKPGSYWIMRDSVSGRIDSFVVTNVGTDVFYSNPSGHDIDIERRTISINEYIVSTGMKNDSMAWQIEVFGYGSQTLEITNTKNGITYGSTFLSLTFDQSNVLINGSLYNGVSISQEATPSSRTFKVFLDRNNILLKTYYKDIYGLFTVWELVRSHIII